jgi:uncharacterized protein with HEPN domain
MSFKRSPLIWLQDMLSATNENINFTEGMSFQEFLRSIQTIKAVLFNLQLIGEASIKVPEELKQTYTEIPWKELRGLRNRVAHEYFDMNLEMIWVIVQEQLPILKPQLEELLNALSEGTP